MRALSKLFIFLASFAMLSACTDPGKNDPAVRGERIHAVCLPCHSTSIYLSSRRKVNSLPELHKEVARWGDYYDPALSAQDIDDVTAYLNKNFYKFDGQNEK